MAALRARAGVPLRMSGALAAVLVLSTLLAPLGPAPPLEARTSGWDFTRAERCFMRKANRVRLRHDRGRLSSDKQLGYVARRHARSIAERRTLAHDTRLGSRVTRWRRLGQNTGVGSGCRSLFRAFMRSSGHRRNILGRWRYMGVGVARRDGRVYVQHVFEARRNPGNVYDYP